jgi:predicted nucleic acid-binding protein
VYVYLSPEQLLDTSTDIPREDIGIYLTAIYGQADYLISANRELLKQATIKQQSFQCLTAQEFIKHISY